MVFEKQLNMSIKENVYHAIKRKIRWLRLIKTAHFPWHWKFAAGHWKSDDNLYWQEHQQHSQGNPHRHHWQEIASESSPDKSCIKAIVEAKEILFIMEVVTSSKMLIFQLDRKKYNLMREYAKGWSWNDSAPSNDSLLYDGADVIWQQHNNK